MLDRELRILLVEDNLIDARLVQEILANATAQKCRVQRAETLMGALDCACRMDFDVALVDLTLPDCQGLETFMTIQRHVPSLPIVVLTGLDNESVALAAVEKGAQDYISKKKLDSEVLMRALQYAVVRQQTGAKQQDARFTLGAVTGVLGAKGGVGATTVASLFAVELRRQTDQPVLLMDLDASSSGCAFAFRLDPRFTVADAATNIHRLDAAFLKGLLCGGTGGIDLLASPGAARRYSEQLSGDRVRHVLRFVRTLYPRIVIDIGRLSAMSLSVIEELAECILVSSAELPELYEAKRAIERLTALGIEAQQLRLLINRAWSPAAKDIEKALGYPVLGLIGDHRAELTEMYAEGSFASRESKIRKQVGAMVARLAGKAGPETKKSGFGYFGIPALFRT